MMPSFEEIIQHACLSSRGACPNSVKNFLEFFKENEKYYNFYSMQLGFLDEYKIEKSERYSLYKKLEHLLKTHRSLKKTSKKLLIGYIETNHYFNMKGENK